MLASFIEVDGRPYSLELVKRIKSDDMFERENVLNQLLVRSDRPDQAMLVSLAGLITTMMLLVREISSLFDLIKSLFGF